MSVERNYFEPAFPHSGEITANGDVVCYPERGMLLRDYFAAKAVNRCIEISAQFVMEREDFEPNQVMLSEVVRRGAEMAYHVADAMLKERAK